MLNIKKYPIYPLYEQKVSTEYKVEIQSLKEGEKPSIMSDTMFKTMFFNQNRIKYSCKFFSYFLEVSYEDLLMNLKLVKNELDKEKEQTKGERCDYVALIKDTYLNIEVNNNSGVEIMYRNVEYAFKQYASKIKVGTKINDSNGKDYYMSVIQFNLNNFSFEGNDKIIDIYTLQNKEGFTLNDKIVIIQIYIPNLRKKCYNEGIKKLSELERYLLTMVEPNFTKAGEIAKGFEIMEEYVDESAKVITDINFGESYDKEWALKDEYLREGMEKGIIQGEKKKQIEIAKNMVKKGIDAKTISECTNLSHEEIESLME